MRYRSVYSIHLTEGASWDCWLNATFLVKTRINIFSDSKVTFVRYSIFLDQLRGWPRNLNCGIEM